VTGQTRTRPAARGDARPMRRHGPHPPSLAWKALATRWRRGLVGLAAFRWTPPSSASSTTCWPGTAAPTGSPA